MSARTPLENLPDVYPSLEDITNLSGARLLSKPYRQACPSFDRVQVLLSYLEHPPSAAQHTASHDLRHPQIHHSTRIPSHLIP